MDTTTIFNSPAMSGCGAQCVDMMTVGLIALATIAVMVIAALYAFAGICKRIR